MCTAHIYILHVLTFYMYWHFNMYWHFTCIYILHVLTFYTYWHFTRIDILHVFTFYTYLHFTHIYILHVFTFYTCFYFQDKRRDKQAEELARWQDMGVRYFTSKSCYWPQNYCELFRNSYWAPRTKFGQRVLLEMLNLYLFSFLSFSFPESRSNSAATQAKR